MAENAEQERKAWYHQAFLTPVDFRVAQHHSEAIIAGSSEPDNGYSVSSSDRKTWKTLPNNTFEI